MGKLLHADFAENFDVIDKGTFANVTTEQNTGYVSVAGYDRIVVIIHALVVGTTVDADIEIGVDSDGTSAVTLKSITQLVAADDGDLICIDIRPDELNNPANTSVMNFDYLNVEVTPSGAAYVSVLVLGVRKYAGEAGSGWDQAVS